MRYLLISAAALALTAGAAFAQPDQEHGHGHRTEQNAPQPSRVQERVQAAPRAQPAPQQAAPQRAAHSGGPTSFTNQVSGQPPDQGRRDRGNWQGRQAAPQQQAVAPQQAPQDRNRSQGRDYGQGYANRGTGQGYASGRGNGQGGYDNRGAYGDNRYASRGGTNYSGFRDFHRDWRATQRFRIGGYHRPSGWYAHRWTFGEFLPRPYWVQDYWLVDYTAYDLPPPPYGAIWVRVNDDALLIDRYSGEIITVVYNVFY